MDNIKNRIFAVLLVVVLLVSCKTTHMENDWEYLDTQIMTNEYEDSDFINNDTIPILKEADIPKTKPDTLGYYVFPFQNVGF